MIQTPAIQWSSIGPSLVLLVLALSAAAHQLGRVGREGAGHLGHHRRCSAFVGAGLLAWLALASPPGLARDVGPAARSTASPTSSRSSSARRARRPSRSSWGTHRLDERIGRVPRAPADRRSRACRLLAASNGFVALFVALELFSISLYVLCALDVWSEASLESGLKYLVDRQRRLGVPAVRLAGSSTSRRRSLRFDKIAAAIQANQLGGEAVLLLGIAMILGGLAFKASAAPFHSGRPTSTRARRRR